MSSIWTFVEKPSNRRLLAWLGGGGAVTAAGIWAVMTYVWPTAECIQQGVKIGGGVSGSTISNSVSGGTVTAGPCVDTSKK